MATKMAFEQSNEPEEDDYMSMTVTDPTPSAKNETLTQRRLRKQREAEARAHPKSKAELAAEAEKNRQAALARSIPEESKGAKMMAKLGYKPGSALGAGTNTGARLEPIGVEVKEGREGVGALSEKKRKFRNEVEKAEEGEKRRKETEGDYRERVSREREEKRAEGMWWGAMKVLQGLDEDLAKEVDVHGKEAGDGFGLDSNNIERRGGNMVFIPLLYRPLIRDREEKERERRRRYDLMQSVPRNTTYDDPEEDDQDRLALGKEVEDIEEEEGADGELEEYLNLPFEKRLQQVVDELRAKWFYCFWCKFRYGSKNDMDKECPGKDKNEHG